MKLCPTCFYNGVNAEVIGTGGAHLYCLKCHIMWEPNAVVETHDPVDHPRHYTQHPSGIECIQITEHMNFNLGNAVKYIWRADLKGGIEDLKKAAWYVEREIERRTKSNSSSG